MKAVTNCVQAAVAGLAGSYWVGFSNDARYQFSSYSCSTCGVARHKAVASLWWSCMRVCKNSCVLACYAGMVITPYVLTAEK